VSVAFVSQRAAHNARRWTTKTSAVWIVSFHIPLLSHFFLRTSPFPGRTSYTAAKPGFSFILSYIYLFGSLRHVCYCCVSLDFFGFEVTK